MPDQARGGTIARGSTGGLVVLVVDDAPTNRIMLSRQLRRKGHTVVAAEDGQAGLRAFLEVQVAACVVGSDSDGGDEGGGESAARPPTSPRPFDLIITDMTMPYMNGDVMVQRILGACAEHCMRVPAIVGVTGNALAEDQGQFLAAGADAVLIKPVQLKAILQAAKPHLTKD
jgi:CheY-like chemotaxis protein